MDEYHNELDEHDNVTIPQINIIKECDNDYDNTYCGAYTMKFKDLWTTNERFQQERIRIETNKQTIKTITQSKLTQYIHSFPTEVQYKIYTHSMKLFWKQLVLFKPYIPIWNRYLSYVIMETSKCFLQNIHFLHLEFNTLPENKRYIMGCQCEFCQTYLIDNHIEYMTHIQNYQNDEDYFLHHIGCHDSIISWNLHNDPVSSKTYNPLYECYKEDNEQTRLDFSRKTTQLYPYTPDNELPPLKFET